MTEQDDDITIIEIVKGQPGGAYRQGLTAAQKTGQACLVCQGTQDLNEPVGWVQGAQVRVHTWHLEYYRHNKTLPPTEA